ncbi:YHYH protein [Ilumatobacter sp.]|uniref:YHYH protein n=1 Tax=Ilumatobacter sp. TaxID=1967498 RepID=UPI003C6A157C
MGLHTHRSRLITFAVGTAVIASACGSSEGAGVVSDATTDSVASVADTTGASDTSASVDAATETETDAAADTIADTVAADPATSDATSDEASSTGDELSVRSEVATSAQWADNVTITIDGGNMLFESDGLPSHEYLDVYLADGRDGKYVAGGVESYDASFEIPIVPTVAESAIAAPNGAIGVAISGAVFFNPYEGDGTGTVANDDNETIDGVPFIDACGGHPLPNAIQYHYHGIPFCITDAVDTEGEHSTLIGYLIDGYGIYGPQDVGGEEPTDLDECMGHTGPTPEFDEDTYHYHVSSEANYISECFTGEASVQRQR